jgi:tetratricopeptide (TPR) repeat protein
VESAGKPILDPAIEMTAWFPAKPTRFVGRVEVMAAASAALTRASGRTAVVFHGIAGVGKTTCAVKLAHYHQCAFGALVFWSAPSDPDQFDDALRLLAERLEAQLGAYGFAMVDKIAIHERLENFLPTLTAVFADADLLLILDNLETLLTPNGRWRDLRWAPLIDALISHKGPSRVILTSRIVPVGLNADTMLIQAVHPLSRDESLLLVRKLPHLRALHTMPLSRCVLTLAQGHPTLLELANAAAADPHRLAFQLVEIKAAMEEAALPAFLPEGHNRLNPEQLQQIFTVWITTVAATVPAAARLLLQALCRMEETDRNAIVVGVNWAALWQRLDQPREAPPLASSVAALVTAGLIAIEPIDDSANMNELVRYRIHSGVVEAIQAITPEPVTAAVDTQLATWWTAVAGGWGTESPQADEDTGPFMLRTYLAAARYLLRQHECNAASCLLERALIRDSYSPVTSRAVIPLLRRIAKVTGALKDLAVLGAAVRRVDPGEAEILLRRAYQQATSHGEYPLASTTAGELVSLLRDQGRLPEALTMASQKIEHTSQAGFGLWTQLSDQGRWLQILNLLGHHEQVLSDLPALCTQMADLPDQRAHNDRVNPRHVRESILDIARSSAVALQRWDEALELNDEILSTKRRRGASPHDIACSRFNDYLPLLHLDRLADIDQLLRDCQDTFTTAGDTTHLAMAYGARADLEDKRDHPAKAVDLQRSSLRLCYVHPDPREISTAHYKLANYLSHAAGNHAEQRAHRITAALLNHFTGDTRELTRTLGMLASEHRSDTNGSAAPTLPTTLTEIVGLVDAGNGIYFGNLVATLCPDSATAEQALADLLATIGISEDQSDW